MGPRKKHTIVSTLRGALHGAEFGEKITIFEMLQKNDPKISIFFANVCAVHVAHKKNTARLRRARRAKSTQLSALCAAHCAAQNLAKKSRFLKFCEKMTQKSRFLRQCLRRARRAQKKKKKKQHGYAAYAAQKAHS